MPQNKYRGVTHLLIFMLMLPILFSLYSIALCIGLAAFIGRVLLYCCGGKTVMNGPLVVADALVEASVRLIEGSMLITDQQFRPPANASRSNNPPDAIYYPQNQFPVLIPPVQMPNNRYDNTTYQQRHLPVPADSPSSVNITVDYPKSMLTYEELLEATNRFSSHNFLGEGGFGFVHKGILADGREVAIKQLKSDNAWGQREFKAEVDVLSRVHHQHLVQYIGCCMAQDKKIIVCEYMPNKTVDYHLHGQHENTIDWPTRLKIAIGAAKGLAYLHEECQPRIIHRDIKAANILLDPTFEAKVADFGLPKFFPDGVSLIVATSLMGTRGYMAPEYSVGEIREKSDTFSFGVVLLELITGKKPIITRAVFSEESSPFETLADWARPLLAEALQNGIYDSLVDSRLNNEYNYDEMKLMIACAAACIRLLPQDRPLISKVALVLAAQTSPDDLLTGLTSPEIHTASTSSTEFQDSSQIHTASTSSNRFNLINGISGFFSPLLTAGLFLVI